MKRLLKITLASVMLLSIICSPAGAYRVKKSRDDYFYPKKEVAAVEKGLYYEDFTDDIVGEKPTGISASVGSKSEMYVAKANVEGTEKNVLRLEHNSGALSLVKNVDKSEYLTAEVKFRRVNKLSEEAPAFVLVARNNQDTVFRILVKSGSNQIRPESSLAYHTLAGSNNKTICIEDGVWNTFGIYINTKESKAGFLVKTDTLKDFKLTDNVDIKYNLAEGVAVGSEFDIDPKFTYIDDIRIYTSSYQGTFEIDYINIDNKDKPYVLIKPKPEPLTLPLTASVGERLVPFVTNVVVNNKVTYYPHYPVYDNGKYFAEYKKTFEALGFTAFLKDNIITAGDGRTSIAYDILNNTLTADGKAYNITPVKKLKDYVMIPVKEIAEILGYTVSLDNNVIYLNKE